MRLQSPHRLPFLGSPSTGNNGQPRAEGLCGAPAAAARAGIGGVHPGSDVPRGLMVDKCLSSPQPWLSHLNMGMIIMTLTSYPGQTIKEDDLCTYRTQSWKNYRNSSRLRTSCGLGCSMSNTDRGSQAVPTPYITELLLCTNPPKLSSFEQ